MTHGVSCSRDPTCVPCISRQILDHWTAREVPRHHFLFNKVQILLSLHFSQRNNSYLFNKVMLALFFNCSARSNILPGNFQRELTNKRVHSSGLVLISRRPGCSQHGLIQPGVSSSIKFFWVVYDIVSRLGEKENSPKDPKGPMSWEPG